MRVASVSKLITAAAIMKLQQEGKITIKDSVFGPRGILNDTIHNGLYRCCDKNYNKITVEHLMRHQAGFSRDPLFSALDISNALKLDGAPTREDYIRLVLSRKLRFNPGDWQWYNNFGYMLLSIIIEEMTSESYEKYVQNHLLYPAGCYDMHIRKIYYHQKRENEVRYYSHPGDGQYIHEFNKSGRMVERCYGGNDIPMLQGAGAWTSSTVELARLIASIDANSVIEDVLNEESINEMTQFHDKSTMPLGWGDVTSKGELIRTGTLSGTSALIKYYPDGECWILVTNTSTYKGPRFTKNTDALFNECRKLYSSKLPKVDLFADDYPLE
jgi:CubicO group peptidase (beta-lactamase class C family)